MAKSLKTKYLLLALGVGAGIALLFGGFAYYEHRIDSADINQLAYTAVAEGLQSDLEARADRLGRETGSLLAPALAAGNRAAVASIAARLLEHGDIERVEVMDANGNVVFTGRASPDGTVPASASMLEPVAVKIAIPPPGGTLQISVSRARTQAMLEGIRAQLESQQGDLIKRMRGMFAGVLMPLLALGLIGAWFIARQWAKPISALIKSADRIGQGDYTRPVGVARLDELGDLQHALERMRQKLSETTITKNYLDTVLNSLSDSVLVTSADGLIKSCNEAAQRLLGYSEADMVGKPLHGFVDAAHRDGFDGVNSMSDARETVLRTASGQTIPVSIASSPISTVDPQFQGEIYVARNITERKRAERRIRYLARYDTLTKNAESHAIPAFAAAGDRTFAPQSARPRAFVSRFGPIQGGERHLRACCGRSDARNPERAAYP